MADFVVLTYQYVRHYPFLHFPKLCSCVTNKSMFQSCWKKIGILSVYRYRLIQVAAVPLFGSCGSCNMLYCEVWTCLRFDIWSFLTDWLPGLVIDTVLRLWVLFAMVKIKQMAKMYICIACGCSLVDVQICLIITFTAICAINRIIHAHNSEAIILFVTYLLQKVLSGCDKIITWDKR